RHRGALRNRQGRRGDSPVAARVGRSRQAIPGRRPRRSSLDVRSALMATPPRHRKVDPLNELRQRKYEAGHGDAEAFTRQHAKGKLTARERIARLVDRNSFEEIDLFATHRAGGFGLEAKRIPGGGVSSPAITDFTFMVHGVGYMFITGPEVIRVTTGEDVTFDSLGGAEVHNVKSGVAHFLAESEEECFTQVRNLFKYIPQSREDQPPRV